MCAVPFLIIAVYGKGSREPIGFWSGDKILKDKVKNVPKHNKGMATLYKKCAIAFLLASIGCMIAMSVGVVTIGFDCTVGIYLVYRSYKKS